ncbi:MAG: oligosaccharide flippase family protein, partial [Patescibacteria group bacterium]
MRKIFKTLSRLFATDAEYLAKGSFWLAVGKIVGMAASFILSIAYARYLSKDLYGNYRYVLSMLGIAGILALPGLSTAMVRAVAQGAEGTFRQAAKIIFFSSFGISLIGLGFALIFFVKGLTALALGFTVGALFVPFGEGLGNWRGYFEGKKDFRRKTLYNIAGHIFYAAVMLAAVGGIFLGKLAPTNALAILLGAYFLAHALPNVIFFRKAMRSVPVGAPQDPEAIRYGLHLSVLNIPATIANYIDSVLLHAYLGPAALAIYSFAIAPVEQLKALLSIVPDVAFPKLSEKTYQKEEQIGLRRNLIKKSLSTSLLTI